MLLLLLLLFQMSNLMIVAVLEVFDFSGRFTVEWVASGWWYQWYKDYVRGTIVSRVVGTVYLMSLISRASSSSQIHVIADMIFLARLHTVMCPVASK